MAERGGLRKLPELVATRFKEAVASKEAFFFDSDTVVRRAQDVTREEAANSVPYQIRNVPSLLKKPISIDEEPKEGRAKQNEKDVFAPPYVPGLLVLEEKDFTYLLNKFCVLPNHFLLVTREFRRQELPPPPPMLGLAYQTVQAYRSRSDDARKELFAFYNCGRIAGASQPHSHFQFVEVAPSEGEDVAVPIEVLLDRIVYDGKEYGERRLKASTDDAQNISICCLCHGSTSSRSSSRRARTPQLSRSTSRRVLRSCLTRCSASSTCLLNPRAPSRAGRQASTSS